MTLPRPVRNLDTGEVFPSVAIAAASVGIAASALSRSIRHGYQAAGHSWVYVERRSDDPQPRPPKRNRPVASSDGRYWPNINAAAAATHYHPGSIYWAIYHRKRLGGLHWHYVA